MFIRRIPTALSSSNGVNPRSNLKSTIFNRKFLRVLCALCVWILAACTPAKTSAPPTLTAARAPQETIVSLTFDDGDADNFTVGTLLQQYNLRATFYIPSGLVGQKNYMTWDELQTLQKAGNEIGGHSLDHIGLAGLDRDKLRHEICDDRQSLMDHGFHPVSFAYPFGNYDPTVEAMLKECGYSSGRTILGGPQLLPAPDPYALLALPYIVSDTDLGKLQRYIAGARKEGGGWVILIFHHVCDSCDYFAVRPDVLNKFVPWLAGQQSMGHVKVKTVGEVVP